MTAAFIVLGHFVLVAYYTALCKSGNLDDETQWDKAIR